MDELSKERVEEQKVAREQLYDSAKFAYKCGHSYFDWELKIKDYAEKHDVTDALEPIFQIVWGGNAY